MTSVAITATTCANCGEALAGAFCPACGQKAVNPGEVTLHEFFHEAFHEFAHVDGKIVQTLKLLLTKPGMLTAEFLAGRRARYIPPLRLYLTCSLVFFGLVAFTPDAKLTFFTVRYKVSAGDTPLDPATLQQREREASLRASHAVVHTFPRVMFALMPVYGLLTWALYRKARPYYAAHLYYSLHLHSFAFLALTLQLSLFLAVGPLGGALNYAAPTVIATYQAIALRRVFGGSRLAAVVKGALIWVVYVFLVLVSVVAAAWGSGAMKLSGPAAAPQHETH